MLQLILQSMTVLVRFGYFDYGQIFHVACARGWFDRPDLSIEVVCLPQSSGGYAVAKLDQGDLDIAVLGSTPWAEAISPPTRLKTLSLPVTAAQHRPPRPPTVCI